jgi:hypothetical protein
MNTLSQTELFICRVRRQSNFLRSQVRSFFSPPGHLFLAHPLSRAFLWISIVISTVGRCFSADPSSDAGSILIPRHYIMLSAAERERLKQRAEGQMASPQAVSDEKETAEKIVSVINQALDDGKDVRVQLIIRNDDDTIASHVSLEAGLLRLPCRSWRSSGYAEYVLYTKPSQIQFVMISDKPK